MTIAELGALGEFLGVFVIFATLVYLAIQTRQTKHIALTEARRSIGNDFNEIWSILGKDEDLTRLIRIAVNDWHALTNNEQMLAHSFFCQLLAHLDGSLSQEETLPELKGNLVAWEDNILGLLGSPGGSEWFKSTYYLFDSTMVKRLKARLEQPETMPPSWVETMSWWKLEEEDRCPEST
jgi:hypothetical protein